MHEQTPQDGEKNQRLESEKANSCKEKTEGKWKTWCSVDCGALRQRPIVAEDSREILD